MKSRSYRIALLNLWFACFALAAGAAEQKAATGEIIDSCAYASDGAAAAAWKPMRGSKPAGAGIVDGQKVLRLPCEFGGNKAERASWDRNVKIDLSKARGIQFKIFCRDASPVTYFSVYLQSGDGWYQALFFPESTSDWNLIEVDKDQMKTEGKPAGWNEIHTVRFSAWRGTSVNTEFYVSDLRATEPLPPPGPKELAEAAIERIGEVASFKKYETATNEIARLGGARVTKALGQVAASRAEARQLVANGKFDEAKEKAAAAQQEMVAAYCLAQKPEPGELRGFWCHNAMGVDGMKWDEAIKRLSENGFNAIFPNMLWGGAAFYQSDVLPVAAQVVKQGDQISECLAACRKHGVQLYVWKVDWNLGRFAPKTFLEKMRQEGRLQMSSEGKEEPWLCPSHPENQKLEIAAMVEVVRKYDVDGIHFDYIRYPGIDHCFCAGCRERFAQASGATLTNWPGVVLAEGPMREKWLDWRRSNITTVVRAVSEQARAIKPKIKLSAAVFRNWSTDRDGVGQDWKLWCEKGYLDFVCPMDYTPSVSRFEAMVSQQIGWAGKTPCYPGIGVSASSSQFGPDRAIEEINITRKHQTHGFLIFNYGVKESKELLPKLALGITGKEKSSAKD